MIQFLLLILPPLTQLPKINRPGVVGLSHGFKCSWLWQETSPVAPDAKKALKVKIAQKGLKSI